MDVAIVVVDLPNIFQGDPLAVPDVTLGVHSKLTLFCLQFDGEILLGHNFKILRVLEKSGRDWLVERLEDFFGFCLD